MGSSYCHGILVEGPTLPCVQSGTETGSQRESHLLTGILAAELNISPVNVAGVRNACPCADNRAPAILRLASAVHSWHPSNSASTTT
jgi:hypothetical protein